MSLRACFWRARGSVCCLCLPSELTRAIDECRAAIQCTVSEKQNGVDVAL